MYESEAFWDKSATKYSQSKISDQESYQKKLTQTQRYLKPDMHVVEFGCGTGSTAIVHAQHVKHIDAIDISENMLEIGRRKADEASIDNITFSRATLTDFNAADASIDVVLGLNVIHLIEDRETTFAEVARILKPGGVFISSTACIGHSFLRFIKLIAPLGMRLGLMPDVYVLTDSQLATEVTSAGLEVEDQWSHGGIARTVFLVARKPD